MMRTGFYWRPWTGNILCMFWALAALVLLGCPAGEKKHPQTRQTPAAQATPAEEKERGAMEQPLSAPPVPEQPTPEEVPGDQQPLGQEAPSPPSEEEKEPAPTESVPPENVGPPEAEPAEKEATKERPDLGEPLVDDPQQLQRLDPVQPIWIDRSKKCVVVQGRICQNNAPLEMFACLENTKEHEAIVAVPGRAFIIHAGLLAVGAKPGRPVQFVPAYVPASGTEIEVLVRWKNAQGEVQTARAQEWVRDVRTGQALQHPWVFGGSGFWRDPETGEPRYQAEGGDFICVANFSTAMLDLPIPSSQSNAELLFQAFTERIPPLGTPVTLLLVPKLDEPPKPEMRE